MDETIVQYLKENLRINVDTRTEFGPSETLTVSLYLDGEQISTDTCSLPDNE